MDRKKTSHIWNFFTPQDDTKAKCNLCKQIISYKTSTSNLKRHFERKHPLVNLTRDSNTQKKNTPPPLPLETQNVSANRSEPQTSTSSSANSTSDENRPSDIFAKKTQAKLPYVAKTIGIHTKKKLDNSLMQLFTKDMQPFSMVEDTGFRNFVNNLNPSYQIPSRKYISNTLLPALYEEKLENIKDVVKYVLAVTVTTDCWTSILTESFMATTIHFLNEKFEAKSILLECSSLAVSHTSANLAAELKRIVIEWGLEEKIFLAISDNAANIQKAIRDDLKWKHFGCYAHTINLIVRDGLKIVEPIISKLRTLVGHFKRSSTAMAKLQEIQKQLGKSPLKLLQDVVTRWNSTYYMVERIIELEEPLRTTMALLNSTNLPIISVEEWQLLSDIKNVLQPMEEVTKIICGQSYVTLSSVIILTKGLENIYISMKHKDNNPPIIQNIVTTILDGISTRLGDLENSQTLLISTFLDPRFKNVGFSSANVAERAKKLVTNLVSSKVNEMSVQNKSSASEDKNNDKDKVETPLQKTSVWGLFDTKAASTSTKSVSSATSRAIIEVQRYVEEELLERDKDPLQWWKQYSYNFPYLSKVVQEKFGVVATSVPCERVFSKSGQLISERRSRLSSDKVKKIMFLNVNFNI